MTQLPLALTEREKAERVLSAMEEEPLRRYLIGKCRSYARELWEVRAESLGPEQATVCADDVREYFETVLQPPEWLSRNCLGAVFAGREWEAVGWTRSEWPGSHGNALRTWRYVGD